MTASNPTTPSSLLSRSPRRSIAPPFIAETFSGVAAKGRITVPLENNGVVCDASTCFDNTTLHRLTSSGGSGKSPSHLVPGCIGPSNHRLLSLLERERAHLPRHGRQAWERRMQLFCRLWCHILNTRKKRGAGTCSTVCWLP